MLAENLGVSVEEANKILIKAANFKKHQNTSVSIKPNAIVPEFEDLQNNPNDAKESHESIPIQNPPQIVHGDRTVYQNNKFRNTAYRIKNYVGVGIPLARRSELARHDKDVARSMLNSMQEMQEAMMSTTERIASLEAKLCEITENVAKICEKL